MKGSVLALLAILTTVGLGHEGPDGGANVRGGGGGRGARGERPQPPTEEEGRGGLEHGYAPPPPHDSPSIEFQQLVVNMCHDDVQTYCADAEDLGACFVANFACFSTECTDAVNLAISQSSSNNNGDDEEEGPHPVPHGGEGRRGKHGKPGHRQIPDAVIESCAADAEEYCDDVEGRERLVCMQDNFELLSVDCQDAITQWLATLPTPPAALVAACAEDKATLCPGLEYFALAQCMKAHNSQISDGCKAAFAQFRHSRDAGTPPAPSDVPVPVTPYPVTPSVSSGVDIMTAQVADALMAPVPSVVTPGTTTICNSAGATTTDPATADVVNAAYDSVNSYNAGPTRSHGFVFHVIGAVVGIAFIVVVAVVVVRRYRARHAARESGQATTTSNPLAYGILTEEHPPQAMVVEGIPVV